MRETRGNVGAVAFAHWPVSHIAPEYTPGRDVAGTLITTPTGTDVLAPMALPGTGTGLIVSPCTIALSLSLPTSETLDKETVDVRLAASVTLTVAVPRVIVGKLTGDPLTQVSAHQGLMAFTNGKSRRDHHRVRHEGMNSTVVGVATGAGEDVAVGAALSQSA